MTAYGRLSPEEFAEQTKDLSPEDREEVRVEQATTHLFLRFEKAFAACAIDRLDVSDADAETAAKRMEGDNHMGNAYAYFLRHIAHARRMRELCHKASAIWAAEGKSDPLSIPEVHARYAKLSKGEA